MAKCTASHCSNEAESGRLLCSRHYAEGLIYRAKGTCIRCKQRLAHNGSMYCFICKKELEEDAMSQMQQPIAQVGKLDS